MHRKWQVSTSAFPQQQKCTLLCSLASPLDAIYDNGQVSLELGETQGAALPSRVPAAGEHPVRDAHQAPSEGEGLRYVHQPYWDVQLLYHLHQEGSQSSGLELVTQAARLHNMTKFYPHA